MSPGWRKAIVLLSAAALAACTQTTHPPTAAAPTATLLPTWILPTDSWIEIDLALQSLRLHRGREVIAEYPVSTGVTTDPQYATPPDLYRVQSKDLGPIESSPGVFVSHVILFDLGRGNAIHSLPMDADGQVLDSTVGVPATAGCVRLAEADRVFEFAKIGIRVWIH